MGRCAIRPGGKELELSRKPTQDVTDGLQLTYTPKVKPLTDPDGEPDLPSDLHRFIVPAVLPRVAQHREAQLAHPEDVYTWAARQERDLRDMLASAPKPIVRRMNFYRARG